MEKVKNQRVIIYTTELLTGSELIEVIKDYKLEKYYIEKVDKKNIYDMPYDPTRPNKLPKVIDAEYIYVFIDKNER